MPPRKDKFWEEQLKSVLANNPSWGAGRIRTALEQIAVRESREDAPGERWVGNSLRKLREKLEWQEELREYRLFSWPESMERGDLPWEASAAALELLRFLDRKQQPRPTIRQAKWFWRLSLVAADAPIDFRFNECKALAAAEVYGELESMFRRVELTLIHESWKSPL